MKTSANHKTPQKPTFTPKPLSIEQRNAIDLLILGKTDQETADTVGVSRETVWSWHHEHPMAAPDRRFSLNSGSRRPWSLSGLSE